MPCFINTDEYSYISSCPLKSSWGLYWSILICTGLHTVCYGRHQKALLGSARPTRLPVGSDQHVNNIKVHFSVIMAQRCQMYKLDLVRTPGLIRKGGDSMWFLVCWATLPVSVIWLWDFCTPGIPRPWGFGHLFVRSFIILVEGKEKQNRHKIDEHELTLELPYWNIFKWLEMYFIFNRYAYIVYRNAFLFLVDLFCVIIID